MILKPNINNPKLTRKISGYDQEMKKISLDVVEEQPLTLFLNSQEIVTMMTINDYPEFLAVGYLLNQNMISRDDEITSIEYEDELNVVVVRTKKKSNFEKKLTKKTITSGCAQGTVFGDIMEIFEKKKFKDNQKLKIEWIYELSKSITLTPSIYLKAGAIHGCVLCEKNTPLIYMEDVGRHNALDKLIGNSLISKNLQPNDQFITCSGRLNFELVQKVLMTNIGLMIGVGAPTSLAIDLANKFDMTLVGFVKEDSFNVYTNKQKVIVS